MAARDASDHQFHVAGSLGGAQRVVAVDHFRRFGRRHRRDRATPSATADHHHHRPSDSVLRPGLGVRLEGPSDTRREASSPREGHGECQQTEQRQQSHRYTIITTIIIVDIFKVA